MGGKDLVDAGQRDGLLASGGAGGVEADRLVIDIVFYSGLGLDRGRTGHIFPVWNGVSAALFAGDDKAGRLVAAQGEGLADDGLHVRVEDEHLRDGVVQRLGKLSAAQTETDRATHGVQLVGGDVCENEFRAVQELEHHDILLAHPVVLKRVAQAVDLGVELDIVPHSVGDRVDDGGPVGISADIAHEPFDPGVFALENLFKTRSFHNSCVLGSAGHNPVRHCGEITEAFGKRAAAGPAFCRNGVFSGRSVWFRHAICPAICLNNGLRPRRYSRRDRRISVSRACYRLFYFRPRTTLSITCGKLAISSTWTLASMSSGVSSGERVVLNCAMIWPESYSELT